MFTVVVQTIDQVDMLRARALVEKSLAMEDLLLRISIAGKRGSIALLQQEATDLLLEIDRRGI